MHTQHDKKSNYWTRSKLMNDFSNLWENVCPEKLEEYSERQIQDVKGNLNRELFEENQKKYS